MATRVARAAIIVAVAAVVAVPALGITSPAQAHNYLVTSTPASGDTLTTLPNAFSIKTNGTLLTFNGSVDGFALQVRDAQGLYYGDGCITVEGPSMSEPAALGAPGDYTMLWQVISTDGHSVSGEVPFTWAPTSGTVTSTGSPTPPDCNGTIAAQPPASTAAPTPRTATVDLSDVIWIGGALGAVMVAALVTFFVLGRRQR